MAVTLFLSQIVWAQESAPVIIDSSPTATELLRRARESAVTNPIESARSLQEAVDRFANKLVPWENSTERFQNTADAAEKFLLSNPTVFESWLREESSTAQRQLAQGSTLQVAQLRPLTPAGLQVMMILAQQELDEGRRSSAHRWIDKALRHPALTPDQKTLLEKAKLDTAFTDISAPPLINIPAHNNSVVQWLPLWNQALPESWLNRHIATSNLQTLARETADTNQNGSALVASAKFTADGVVVADGAVVRMLDQLSGVERWKRNVLLAQDRTSSPPNAVAVAVPTADLVITLPGQALLEQRDSASRVVAMSILNGEIQWDVDLNKLGPKEFNDLVPHGVPIIIDDVVVVQARKSNERLESAAWLIALDRNSGEFLWANSLGAAGGVRLAVSRPLSSPTQFQGDVIAATSLGVMARIDATNGNIVWLRKWGAPLREPRTSNPAWQLPSPVVSQGSVFWIEPDQNTLVCLSAEDGSTQWSITLGVSEQLPSARSLLADQERLYLLGEDVVAVDLTNPKRVLWQLSEVFKRRVAVRGECALGTDSLGRVLLAVPLEKSCYLLDPASGRVCGETSLFAGGNLQLHNGQLVVVDARQASFLMEATEGERMLRARLANNPNDPRNGLALLELGHSWASAALLFDGATAMSAALTQQNSNDAALRDELLLRLLDAIKMKEIDQAMQVQLLAIANQIAVTPTQRANVILCQGDLAAQHGRLEQALEQWAFILNSPELLEAMVLDDACTISAQAIALERILSHPQTTTMQARQRLAQQARSNMLVSDSIAFIHALNTAILLACDANQAQQILQEAEQRARTMGWKNVQDICLSMHSDHAPGFHWPRDSAAPLAKLGALQSRATVLPGRILSMSTEANHEKSLKSLLLAEPTSLCLRDGDRLDIMWRALLGDRDPIIMAMLPNIVLWCQQLRNDGVLFALNPADGKNMWRVDSVVELFSADRLAALPLETANEREDAAAISCMRAGPVCALVRSDGELIAVNLSTGVTQWKLESTIHALQAQQSSPQLIVIAGLLSAAEDEENKKPSWIQAINAQTGAIVGQRALPQEWGSVRWMQILPDCLLVATDEVIAALEFQTTLSTRWSTADLRYKDSMPLQIAGPWCLLKEKSAMVVALRIATGKMSALPFVFPSSAEIESNQISVQPYQDQWLVKRPLRITLHDLDGSLEGADAIAVNHRFEQIVLGQNSVCVLDSAAIDNEAVFRNPNQNIESGPDSEFRLRQFLPADGLRAVGEPIVVRFNLGRSVKTDAIDGWILFGGDDKTMLIPAPFSH